MTQSCLSQTRRQWWEINGVGGYKKRYDVGRMKRLPGWRPKPPTWTDDEFESGLDRERNRGSLTPIECDPVRYSFTGLGCKTQTSNQRRLSH